VKKHDEALSKAMEIIVYKKKKIQSNAPWYNEDIEGLNDEITKVRRKRSGQKKNAGRFSELTSRLTELNKLVRKTMRNAVKEFMQKVHEVNNIDQFWLLWKRTKLKVNDNVPVFENNKTGTLKENIEILADQFIRKSTNKYEIKKIKLNKEIPLTNEEELKRIIKKMSNNKAPGPDGIPNKLIKIIYEQDPDYMVNLYNVILKKATIPNTWKKSRMIFFAKPNRKAREPSDFRPICLINGFMKITEALFARRIEEELDRIEYFVDNQFGFRKNFSTESAIVNVINNIKTARKYKYAAVIALDFSSAFDNLSWNSIINNLINKNTDNSYIKMAQDLLVNRCIRFEDTIYKTEIGTP
jgi:hypothetical protein